MQPSQVTTITVGTIDSTSDALQLLIMPQDGTLPRNSGSSILPPCANKLKYYKPSNITLE
jgi:hypothetical protein